MDYVTIIGLTTGTLSIVAFLPQVIKVWKTKSTHDVSIVTFILLCGGVLTWIVYGTYIKDLPVILTNSAIFFLVSIILFFKIKYR